MIRIDYIESKGSLNKERRKIYNENHNQTRFLEYSPLKVILEKENPRLHCCRTGIKK